jgi:hypothetical protein
MRAHKVSPGVELGQVRDARQPADAGARSRRFAASSHQRQVLDEANWSFCLSAAKMAVAQER